MTRHPRPPSPNPPPPPPPPPAPADPDPDFDPVAEWLLDLDDDVDFDQAMASEFDKTFGLGDEEVFPLPGEIEPTGCDVAIPVLEDDGVMSGIGELGVDPVKEDIVGEKDELLDLFDAPSGVEFDVEKEEAVILGGGLDAQPGPDQHPLLGVSDLVAKEDSLDGAIDADMSSVAAADAEMFALPAVETEMVTAAPVEAEMSTVASVHAALSSEVSVNEEVEGGGGKGVEESKGEDSESSEDEEDEESDESSSSSDEEEEMTKEDVESSEASSSSDDEVLMGKKQGRVTDMEALLEEGELMVGIDDDDEGEAGKGPIKSKNEVKELPPVPKIEVQLEPHHKALPVGAISAIMGERVIVEGSVEHSPLTEGSILWITESRTPLGIVDELFGPVKNPYYLVRYNTTEEVPAGISAGTTVSFVAEFANHILNMKELYAKGYDESADHDEEADEPEFSDDEKEAEYKRSLRQSKRQTDRQHESKKSFGDKKRVQHRGAGFRKDMPPRVHGSPTLGQQSQHRFHHSDMPPAVADSVTRRSGPQNFPMSAPTMLPPIPMNHAVPSAVQLANQMGSCFINPSQQFSPQQQNMVWPGGLPPPPQPNIGVDGAAFAANIMQNILIGANQYQQYLQNQNFGGFPNGMPMAPPQFMPGSGMPVNPMQFGAPPVNHPFDPASQNIGQGNFGPASQNMGQGNFGPASQNMGQGNFGPAPQNMGQENFGQLPHMAGDQGPPPGFPNAQGYGGIPTLHENGDQPPGFPSTQGYGRLPSPHGGGGQPPMQFNSGQFNQGNSSFRGRKPQQRGGRQSRGRGGGGRHRR